LGQQPWCPRNQKEMALLKRSKKYKSSWCDFSITLWGWSTWLFKIGITRNISGDAKFLCIDFAKNAVGHYFLFLILPSRCNCSRFEPLCRAFEPPALKV
jgi:hypothetical protein